MTIVVGESVVHWTKNQSDEFGDFYNAVGIGIEKNNKLIAGVVYDHYNGVSVQMHVAATTHYWLTREFLWMCFDYPFNQLKVKRLTGLVGERNFHARRFDERLGFTLEASLEKCHRDGKLLVYRMFREDCRWLTRRGYDENLHQDRLAMAA